MSLRKPLVLINGRIGQLPSSDTLDAQVSEVGITNRVNDNAGTINIGQPVYPHGAGHVDLAKADAAATADVLGLVKDVSIATTASGNIQTDGILTATTAQWDAVTGQVGGLTPDTYYFLDDANPGKLVIVQPTTVGHFFTRIGLAVSSTDMEIRIEQAISL